VTEDLHELVSRARRRETQAFETLIRRYERSALAVAYALFKDADRAGDAVQEAFLRAWQQLPRLKESHRFAAWLMQIVRHAAIDMKRRIKPTTEYPDWQAADSNENPVTLTQAAEASERVRTALETLDETTRTILILRYYEGLATREIAELVEMSPAAVDMRLSRGRGELKEHLADLVEGETARIGDRS